MRSAYGSIPMTFGPARAGPFFTTGASMTERAGSLPRRPVVRLVDRRERCAEDRLRLVRRSALHQYSPFVDVSALERLPGDAPSIGLAGPNAQLDPPPPHLVAVHPPTL